MVRRKDVVQAIEKPTELLVSHEDARARLSERIQKGLEIKEKNITTHDELEGAKLDFSKWDSFNIELLNRLFSTDKFAKEYTWSLGIMLLGGWTEPPLPEKIRKLFKDIDDKIHLIDSIVERLELIPEQQSADTVHSAVSTTTARKSENNRVFVVHGHDDTVKESVARVLEKLSLEAIVLHEQPNNGNTIIEKFEQNSDVAFAVVLLTPDDVGAKQDSQDSLNPRARQNVIFELGFFCGKLGRKHVAALIKGGIEIPSDYNGIAYINIDPAGAWKFQLAQEFKAAGMNVDLNDLC